MQKPDTKSMSEWIELNKTMAGGWTKKFIVSLDVGWPPPKHWKRDLERGKPVKRRDAKDTRQGTLDTVGHQKTTVGLNRGSKGSIVSGSGRVQ